MKTPTLLGTWSLASALFIAVCAMAASNSLHSPPAFHASIPAGYDILRVQPTGAVISFLGLIECPDLEGAQQVAEGMNARIVNADGKRLTHFPSSFSFRITASLRKTILAEPTDTFTSQEEPEQLLLKLRFRLKAFHALEVREIQPESVRIIGVPSDVASDERIYRVNFNVENLPVTDRCVLEVLSPSGERLTKFHFDLL